VRTFDKWEVWIKFKSKVMREKFDEYIKKMIDKGWYIEDVVFDTGLNLYIKLKK
jgi:hypothetical protein